MQRPRNEFWLQIFSLRKEHSWPTADCRRIITTPCDHCSRKFEARCIIIVARPTIIKHKVKRPSGVVRKRFKYPTVIGTTLCLPPRPPVSQCLQIEKQTRQPIAGTHTSLGDGGPRKQCFKCHL